MIRWSRRKPRLSRYREAETACVPIVGGRMILDGIEMNDVSLVDDSGPRRVVLAGLVAGFLYAMTTGGVEVRLPVAPTDRASMPTSVSAIAPFAQAEVPPGFSFRSIHVFDVPGGVAARAVFVGPGTGNHVTYTKFADHSAAVEFIRTRASGSPKSHGGLGRCDAASSKCFAAVGPFVVSAGSQPECHSLSDPGSLERARILLEAGAQHLRE